MSFTFKAPIPTKNKTIEECHTLGEHLRKTRIDRNESQPCVAHLLNVDTVTITNWELGYTEPKGQHTAKILSYLPYTPLLDFAGTSLSKRVKQFMYVNGLTQKECAKKLGVDPSSLSKLIDEQKVITRTRNIAEGFFEL